MVFEDGFTKPYGLLDGLGFNELNSGGMAADDWSLADILASITQPSSENPIAAVYFLEDVVVTEEGPPDLNWLWRGYSGGGGSGGQQPNPLATLGIEYILDKIVEWTFSQPGNDEREPANFSNFDPADVTQTILKGDTVRATTDNGETWYIDLDRSNADGWEAHVKFDPYGFPWVDLGDGAGYRLPFMGR